MKMRLAKQGKNEGNHFWGCSGYPNCKGVQDATEEDVKKYNNAQAPVNAVQLPYKVIPPTAIVINQSQSSYEFGKATNRHKIYYNDVKYLKDKIDELKQAGLVENELEIHPEDFGKENGTQ